MRMFIAAICALAWSGCLENPYPDSRLGQEKNVMRFRWQSSSRSLPDLELRLARTPGGSLALSGRGARYYDSVEFVIFVTNYHAYYPPLLGTPLPNRMEYHGVLRGPDTGYVPVADIPDAMNGGDLRHFDGGAILLRARGGTNLPVGKWGGVYAGACSEPAVDPVGHVHPGDRSHLLGYIDADGYFAFRCYATEQDHGSVTTGRIGEDSLIANLDHREFGSYDGATDTTGNLRFTWHGDSLSATFHLEHSGYTHSDTSHFEAVRVMPQ
jgi:hypothetical protein